MDFRVLNKISYGLYVVTSWQDGKPMGCIGNTVMQITSDPPTFAISINRNNATHESIIKTGKFAVSILSEKSDPKLIGTFGFKSGRDTDKFEGIDYTVKSKLPVITDSCGYLACELIDRMEAPTHTVFLGKLIDAELFNDEKEMTYAYYRSVIKGTSPKAAPTYNPNAKPEPEPEARGKLKKFKCDICGFVYEGESLPDDYVCPVCGVGAEHFTEIE